jgi:hypothetical protein
VDTKTFGDATLHGWREKVSNRVARRVPVADDVARAVFGLFWFAVSLRYVVRSVGALTRELRS